MKNKFKKTIILSFITAVSLCVNTLCYAIDFIPDGEKYKISGNAGKVSSNMLSLNVESNKDTAHKSYILTDDDGNFSYSFIMSDGVDAGKYTVKLTDVDRGEIYSHDFVYADKDKKLEIIGKLKDAKERSTAKTALDECIEYSLYAYPTSFKISEKILNSVHDAISQTDDFTLENYTTNLNEIFAVSTLKCATEENIDKILTEYSQVYKFENERYYSIYESFKDVTDANKKFLKNEIGDLKQIRELFNEITVLHKMCSEESPGGIADIIVNYSDVFPSSVTKLSYNDKVKLGTFILNDTINTMTEMKNAVSDMKGGSSGSVSSISDRNLSSVSETSSFASNVAATVNAETGNKPKYEFADLRDAEWAREAIYALSNKEIINGYDDGDFRPNSNITREEFVKIIVCAFSLNTFGSGNSFVDVPQEHWAYNYISSAGRNGIVKGDENGAFGIGQNITRQDMAVIIYNVLELSGKAEDFEINEEFSDAKSIADYAKKSVNALKAYKISDGYTDGTFMPLNNATRAEAAQLIYKVLQFANLI